MNAKTLPSLLIVGANLAAGALVAATAILSAPAFASGFGPATSYNPAVGAPASQRGVSTLTVKAEERFASARYAASNRADNARPAPADNQHTDSIGMNTPVPGTATN